MKKPATRLEREHLALVASLPCIACGASPVECHHIAGHGVRASHFETIPLCPKCHRHGPVGTAIHSGRRSFEARYGTERELLSSTLKRLGVDELITESKILPRKIV